MVVRGENFILFTHESIFAKEEFIHNEILKWYQFRLL